MPCQIPDDELEYLEKTDNRERYGVFASDGDIAATVACQACRVIENRGLMKEMPTLVIRWWNEHQRRDRMRPNKRKEADEQSTLKRLMKKHPNIVASETGRHLECWKCHEPIKDGRYNLDEEGPSHKPKCP